MPRIFRNNVTLTPDTVVAAWEPHNGFGDVNVKDVYLTKLKDVDFKKRGYRNLVIPDIGYATVYKTDSGFNVVDADAEANQKQAELDAITSQDPEVFAEKVLDDWDDFLTTKGFSYIGEEETTDWPGGSTVYYVNTKHDTNELDLVVLYKKPLLRYIETGRKDSLENYVDGYQFVEGSSNLVKLNRLSPMVKKALTDIGVSEMDQAYSKTTSLNPKEAYRRVYKDIHWGD